VLAAKRAILADLEALGGLALVLVRRVVPILALGTLEADDVSHDLWLAAFFFLRDERGDECGAHCERCDSRYGAHEQNRTVDLILTKDVLCQLSYMGLRIFPRGAVEITSFPASSGTVYLKGSERCSSVPA
jgi:hypothetical protein